ncbi:hypothetical protein KAFR_0K02210 [Kazachstania africana CBS 2517]|uniref:Uncharacterized protein n=1 Tax=Kazachstania africana (strain ATCC 22294 / BCRC 22015 / CBS 2517 / CECT 1963 / NBRC 1671 / NRRL Y-8276) TaxID=1071382 RepID=H2B1S5_KAZAF|nr:hypothetical protein KAFR_0K02210 [Kazachstania africana CBS 2517]CCF60575.1 hypothetical protein KAFR_0K02210 [Kazachstania africana CBS 2517]
MDPSEQSIVETTAVQELVTPQTAKEDPLMPDPVTTHQVDDDVPSVNLSDLQKDLSKINSDYTELQSLILSKDSITTHSIENLFDSLKIISHNQSVLENKLEDALKNQMNTDLLVNNINDRLNTISTALLKNKNSHTLSDHTFDLPTSSSSSNRRGPGRPRKENFFSATGNNIINSNNSNHNSNNNNNIQPLKVSLPTGSVQISKSKRYFVDPLTNVKSNSPSSVDSSVVPSSAGNPATSKKRRGRPPKKRTVDTVIKKFSEEDEHDSQEHLHSSPSRLEDESDNNAVDDEVSETEEEAEDDEEEDGAEEFDEDYNEEGDDTKTDGSRRRRRRRRSNWDKNGREFVITTKETSPGGTAHLNKQQRELDKLRDPREKMLVSMKYNDRDKTKSFMESNRKLLMAMKEDERRRRMTSMVYDNFHNQDEVGQMRTLDLNTADSQTDLTPSSTNQQQNQTTDSNGIMAESTINQTNIPLNSTTHKKVGLSAILNSDDSGPTSSNQNTTPKKRLRSELSSNPMDDDLMRAKTKEEQYEELHPLLGPKSEPSDNLGRQLRKKRLLSSSSTTTTALTPTATSALVPTGTASSPPPSRKSSELTLSKDVKPTEYKTYIFGSPIELLCKGGFFYNRDEPNIPITTGTYLDFKFKAKEEELLESNRSRLQQNKTSDNDDTVNSNFFGLGDKKKPYAHISNPNSNLNKHERNNAHYLKQDIAEETALTCRILRKTILTEKYVNSLEYFLMEFEWENKLVELGLKLRESKRTWQRRKALFTLFEFWRDQSREKRGFKNFTILHSVKEMENYRIFINRSVSWFYNHITLLKMILYDLCDNIDSQWREWMFPRDSTLPYLGQESEDGASVSEDNINEAIDNMLMFDFLDNGSLNNQIKSSKVVVPMNL